MPMGFRNRWRCGHRALAAVLATLPGNPAAADRLAMRGGFAVYLYCRRTGFRLDVVSGVKIGWITGLPLSPFHVGGVHGPADSRCGRLPSWQNHGGSTEELADSGPHDDQHVSAESGQAILVLLAAMFVFVTCLSMAGGALGAKLVGSSK